MTEQLVLVPKPPRPLTDRQQRALELITEHQPVASEELGRLLGARERWRKSSGREVARALKARGLVRESRKHHGWTLPDYQPTITRPSLQTDVIPF